MLRETKRVALLGLHFLLLSYAFGTPAHTWEDHCLMKSKDQFSYEYYDFGETSTSLEISFPKETRAALTEIHVRFDSDSEIVFFPSYHEADGAYHAKLYLQRDHPLLTVSGNYQFEVGCVGRIIVRFENGKKLAD